MHYSRRQ